MVTKKQARAEQKLIMAAIADKIEDDRRADKRLADAAPELLAALRGLLEHLWTDRKRDVRLHYHLMVAEEAAKTAIAHAE